jgi:hypothetical protein
MYEQASERWSPVQSVEKVLLSVISMLAGTVYMCFSFIVPRCPFLLIHPNTYDRAEPREWREH